MNIKLSIGDVRMDDMTADELRLNMELIEDLAELITLLADGYDAEYVAYKYLDELYNKYTSPRETN